MNRHISTTIATNLHANNNRHQVRHNAKHATTTPTTPPPFNHLRHYASFQTPSSTDHATTPFPRRKPSENAGIKNARERKALTEPVGVFPACFSAAGVKGRGGAARSRLVDARREAVGGEERPFGRSCSKEGGAENGVERRAEPRAIKGGSHARLAPLPMVHASLLPCLPGGPVLLLSLFLVHARPCLTVVLSSRLVPALVVL